ncbi:alkaline phosphatase family protein [Thermococcus gorgonarius]|uniref:Phosphodiesterase n=1 Tax=Thermococcus gorgonarius TaxID=71997 RepID=A0A2Z2M7N7_THEGO|nr:alkaline phosphatase family protein [Thermococcus gorgonarius]ASJ01309.1 phosphodiesterase [Thermococcus gorgonarius]
MKNKKVVVIGLDGANKTTAKLVGVDTQLHDFISTIPPYTPPSWTSILTGVNPAKHGIIGWQKVSKLSGKVSLATSRDVKYPRLTEILEEANLKSILINLPMTYPFNGIRKKENTIIVSDWAAPKQAIYPEELEKKYSEYLIDPPHEWSKHKKSEYPKRVKEYTETRMGLYYDLLERQDWNLYFIVFSEIDWFSHIFPQILEGNDTHIVAPTFRLIKKFIETAQAVSDVMFIVSDHGFEVKNKIFYVNEALSEKGFIKYRKSKAKLVKIAKRTLPKKILNRITEKTKISSSAVNYVAQNASAFMVEPATWGVYVRNMGKKKEIMKALSEYEEVFDVLEFGMVHKGPYLKNMPELIVIPEKGVEFSHELGKGPMEKTYKGDHEIHGVFSAYGKHIKEDIKFEKLPRVYDIVPTVLHVFGLPIPNDTDGRVLREIFEENSEFALSMSKRIPMD